MSNLKGSTDTLRPVQEQSSPVDNSLLARGIEVNDEHSTIIKSQSSNSSLETTAFAYMAGTLEEVARRFEEQARVQREQLNMTRAQQESIDTLNQMLSQLLRRKRNRRVELLLRSPRENRRKGKAHLMQTLRMKSIPILSLPNLHLKRRM